MEVDENGVPLLPDSLQLYDSYSQDPPFAKAFTYVWVSATAFGVLLAFPRLIRSLRNGRFIAGVQGIREDDLSGVTYEPLYAQEKQGISSTSSSTPREHRTPLRGWMTALASWTLYSPSKLRLDIGQLTVIAGYFATLIVTILKDAQLKSNANRAGFLAVAQLPLIFLLATKNNILAALLGRGYEKLNFLHRWSGRAIFLATSIHGALWIQSHRRLHASLTEEKELRGLVAYAILCVMVIISFRPIRERIYQIFFISHIVGFVSFFILVCHHTPYAQPWIFPALAFYGLDMLLRLLRFRFKPASLHAEDNQFTVVNVDRCDFGWVAGQHIRLRVLVGGRAFESHSLSICNAPASISNISSAHGRILLGVRAIGDWTRSINTLAQEKDEEKCCDDDGEGRPVMVMIDGPYGGINFDLGRYENVLLVAGGAGITFTMGVLDDLVGRIVRVGRRHGERTRKIEFAWCIRSYGCIRWFSSQLQEIASAAAKDSSLELHMKFFVTCLCDPEAAPHITNSEITIIRPSIPTLLDEFVARASESQGGIGIATSGPESLVAEARNSVATLGTQIARLGGVALHTEVFSL
ncbi:hypothetical protein CPB86DRAFT_1133 [Serendipita vermifera]|nr:hypothetical protein CPB86DRAFT_1133 [Serendipita vermifera]